MQALTPREANIFACLTDTVAAPGGALPPLAGTDAVRYMDDYVARSPRLNAAGLRALLYAAEVAPLAFGFGARLRRLDAAQRVRFLQRVAGSRAGRGMEALAALGKLAYYGDEDVMGLLGYDADGNLARGREVRRLEGRW
jgi:hypothetical protein